MAGYTSPYNSHIYIGKFASESACLTEIQARKWDSNGDGTGDPIAEMMYFDTTVGEFRFYDGTQWREFTFGGDHGDLSGLADDDHTQYHNDTRGDARYYQKTEFIDSSTGAGDAGKPIKLDADGNIDASMINDADIDHGSIGGLGDDDHTQYLLADGTRALGGNWSAGGYRITNLGTPTAAADAATKEYVDQHRDWQESVLDKDLTTPPGSPSSGDRYIIATGGTGAWSGHDDDITEWDGSQWTFLTPTEGTTTRVEDEDRFYVFDGISWGSWDAATDHGLLLGLSDDDHTQYHNDTRGDARYYQKTEFIDSSAGAGDAGKPIKLDADGNIDASMINDADIDHGSISGLSDDDHTQYHNDTRGDARYYTQTQLGSTTDGSEGASLIGTDTKANLNNATDVETALTYLNSQNPPKRSTNAGNPNGSISGAIGDICIDTSNGIKYMNVDGTNSGWEVI